MGHYMLRLLMETGPPFYVVIRATRRSSRLQGKGRSRKYLQFSVILRPWVSVRPRESNPRPPVRQSSALPTELICAAFENGLAPPYIADLSQYHLRNRDFVIPRFWTVAYGRHSLTYLGPVIWPRLDIYIFYRLNLWTFSKSVLNWLISQVCLTALVKTVFYVTTNNWVLHFIFYWLLHFIFIDNQMSNCS